MEQGMEGIGTYQQYERAVLTLAEIRLQTRAHGLLFLGASLDFLIGRPQLIRIGDNISSSLIFNPVASQDCAFSPLLNSLQNHDFVAQYITNLILVSPMISLLSAGSAPTMRQSIGKKLRIQGNNLAVIVSKMKTLVVDERKQGTTPSSLTQRMQSWFQASISPTT